MFNPNAPGNAYILLKVLLSTITVGKIWAMDIRLHIFWTGCLFVALFNDTPQNKHILQTNKHIITNKTCNHKREPHLQTRWHINDIFSNSSNSIVGWHPEVRVTFSTGAIVLMMFTILARLNTSGDTFCWRVTLYLSPDILYTLLMSAILITWI